MAFLRGISCLWSVFASEDAVEIRRLINQRLLPAGKQVSWSVNMMVIQTWSIEPDPAAWGYALLWKHGLASIPAVLHVLRRKCSGSKQTWVRIFGCTWRLRDRNGHLDCQVAN